MAVRGTALHGMMMNIPKRGADGGGDEEGKDNCRAGRGNTGRRATLGGQVRTGRGRTRGVGDAAFPRGGCDLSLSLRCCVFVHHAKILLII